MSAFVPPSTRFFSSLIRPQTSYVTSRVSRRHRPSIQVRRFPRAMSSVPTGVTPKDASELLSSSTPPKYLDVRTPTEYSAGHAPGALNVPVMINGAMVPTFIEDVKKVVDSDAHLLVGCKSGKRSQAAISLLQQAGFSSLTNVDGGFDAWSADASLAVEK